jgi:hypothetical protein
MNKHPYYDNYVVDKNGSVFNRHGKKLKPISHHTGYQVYTMRKDGKQKQVRAHRFVWEAIVGDIPEHLQINHKDGDKHNNHIANLELATGSENVIHRYNDLNQKSAKGEDTGKAKITADDVRHIRNSEESNKQLAVKYNLHPNYISLVRHKRRWKHID